MTQQTVEGGYAYKERGRKVILGEGTWLEGVWGVLTGVSPAPVCAMLWLKVEPESKMGVLLWPRNTAPPRPPATLLTTRDVGWVGG